MLPSSTSGSAPQARSFWMAFWQRVAMITLLGWATGCASLPPNVNRPHSTAFDRPLETPLGQLAQSRRGQAGARSDSAFRLLDTVDLALTSRLALAQSAQRSLDLQYYAIHADASTEALLQHIRQAARRGVKVRILLDDFNSVGDDAQVLGLAFEPNIEIRLFNPLPGSRNNLIGRIVTSLHDVARIQKRMHNKVFIADNAWGITGGRNLGDQYFGSGDKSNFVDLDVLAAGRIVLDMSASFDRYWNDALAYPVQALLSAEELNELRTSLATQQAANAPRQQDPQALTPNTVAPRADAASVLPTVSAVEAAQADRPALDLSKVALTWAPATLLVDKPGKIGPGDDEVNAGDTVVDGLLFLMEQAQRDVLIISPYFVPGARMMAVYEQLRRRGVRIRILTNSLASNDAPAAHAGYVRYRPQLLAMGVELHEMRADPGSAAHLIGPGPASSSSAKGRSVLGGGPGGSKASGSSRASLHSKAVIIDGRLAVVGSMNLDLRSQLKNSEMALLIRSRALAAQATLQVERTLAGGAYRLELRGGRPYWRAPPGADFADSSSEPEASVRLKLLVKLLGPLAPDEML